MEAFIDNRAPSLDKTVADIIKDTLERCPDGSTDGGIVLGNGPHQPEAVFIISTDRPVITALSKIMILLDAVKAATEEGDTCAKKTTSALKN